ncbi:hypothetical protein GCM10008959_27710 [Deinococcus seoulensis]|uniref:DUF11 domain-containing protein n=1 Tax=Deinococcus seoulensis TaxID=1837379 RepID=A0ABQ2RTD8_9DEIO|nr:DUF11 domain-containing protein [Deinococcus seoulensis]GGR64005.1 hypothetical protein GCM10008959_27710 [Deinococcus seoulensis]
MRAPLHLLTSLGPLLAALVLLALLGSASAQQAFGTRYANTATNGDIVLIGNMNFHCLTVAPATAAQITACNTARSGGTATNNNVYMQAVDTDTDPLTTNSSSATLTLGSGSSVLFAGLYWSGISTSAANRAAVRLATPASASVALTATRTSVIGSNYQSFVDVTTLVQAGGSGTYTAGNVASTAGGGSWAGWTLVVAYRNPAQPTRNLAVFDGFLQASDPAVPVDISVSGFITPSVGTVRSTIGVVAYDGDRGSQEGVSATPQGSLRFGPNTAALNTVSNTVNPVNDVFNSTISTTTGAAGGGTDVTGGRTPAFTNTLGLDIDTFTPNTPLPNGSTSAVVRVIGTSNDVIFPGVITLATEIFVPNIKDALTKTVTDLNGGVLLPGDTLEYELVIRNQGNDGALNVILTDPIPARTTYLPGSMTVTGANAGAKTDLVGDDQAEFDAAGNRVVFRLGSGANAATGGAVLPNEETRVRFRVTVNAGTPGGTTIDNTGTVNYRQQTLGTSVSDTSDSDPVTAGDQPARVTVASPDLSVTKTHTGTFSTGVPGTFTLRVSNAGPAPTTGTITLTDTLPAGMTAQSIAGSGWTCTVSPLRCTRTDPLNPGGSYPDVTLTVLVSPDGTYTNTASVSGGGEAPAQTGNNAASDTVTVTAQPPVVVLTKSVRNVTRSGAASTSSGALPGEILEYCIAYRVSGGDAANFVLRDTSPPQTLPQPGAYGAGLGLLVTRPAGTVSLTSAADADPGSISGQDISVRLGTVTSGETGSVCFRASVR